MSKTPISYYGGKITMLKHILPLIPKHHIYTEAFFGGGAVFFAKEAVESEIINDTNAMVVNFFSVVKTDYEALKKKIEATPFSRATYNVAWAMYRMPHLFDCIQLAWAFYIATNMGFACMIGSWGFDKYGKRKKAFLNKKIRFDSSVFERLENTQIESSDASKIIKLYDSETAFHYVDPPYIDSHQGHYGGYCQKDYEQLLETLSNVKGKFLLSSYPSEILEKYTKQNHWYTKTFDKPLSAQKSKDGEAKKRKTEVLTANYPI